MLVHVIDILTAAASLGVKFIGYPAQIRANRDARRKGMSAGLVGKAAGAMFVSYLLWVIHGVAVHDWVEIVSQGFGLAATGILLVQAEFGQR